MRGLLLSIMGSIKFLIYSLSYHEILLLAYLAWYNPVISWSAKAQLFSYIFQQFEPGVPYRSSTTLANEFRRLSQPVAPSPRSLEQTSSRSASPNIQNATIVGALPGHTKAELPVQELPPTRPTDCSCSQCLSSPFEYGQLIRRRIRGLLSLSDLRDFRTRRRSQIRSPLDLHVTFAAYTTVGRGNEVM